MAMISTRGRYALRVMVDLAEHDNEEYIPLMDIATRQGISEKYLEGILAVLSKNGLLKALRGRGGGYRLSMPAHEYTLYSILRLTENLDPVACTEDGASCERAADCRTLPVWLELQKRIRDYLSSVTLMDLVQTGELP